MLKSLIKKQYYECFRGYFINNKTGKAKSKASIISTFVFFAFAMLILSFCFYGLAYNSSPFLSTEYKWLYYSLFGMTAIGLGIFASVFSTSKSLYNAKDNDLLLSMPIKEKDILLSRISLVYGLSLLYTSVAWIPICILPFVEVGFDLVVCLLDIILLFVIALFTSVLSCAVGYVVAAISRKVKNRSLVTTLLSLIFLGAYYFVCFKFSSIAENIVLNGEAIADKISTWGYLFYQLGLGASGNILSFIIFTVICIALAYVCYIILVKSFTRIATHSGVETSTNKKIVYKQRKKLSLALLGKEFRRFVSTPIYLLNCGLGIVFVIAAGVYLFIKASTINPIIEAFSSEFPIVKELIPLVVIVIICLIIVINAIAVPSIALEGKNLWILKSLPIKTIEILNAKRLVQVLFNAIPSVIVAFIICYALNVEISNSIMTVLNIFLYIEISASIALLVGMINPNFTWTNEAQPIKQNLYLLLDWAICLVLLALLVGSYYFFYDKIQVFDYLEYMIIAQCLIFSLLRRLLDTWAVKKFNEL
ncbi:MAG: hypothetical protein Q4E33_00545 [Erysipelotrichaceae bacterium]|nr:hypothetical protein [Erysipelotrichaceae bacterium]